MSLDAIKAAQAAREQAAQTVNKEEKNEGKKPLAAHEEALAKGIPVAKSLRLRKIILRNGQTVKPTAEGYFIALNEEIAEQLDHFSKQYGMVEARMPKIQDKK